MRRIGLVAFALVLCSAGPAWAQAEAESAVPDVEALPPMRALVRYKPRSGAAGDWMLGTMSLASMGQRTCNVVFTHVADDPAYVVFGADSLELAWRDGAALFPHNRAQVDSMAHDVAWHTVNLSRALEGLPECRPSFR